MGKSGLISMAIFAYILSTLILVFLFLRFTDMPALGVWIMSALFSISSLHFLDEWWPSN